MTKTGKWNDDVLNRIQSEFANLPRDEWASTGGSDRIEGRR